jgi:hypothetical protein
MGSLEQVNIARRGALPEDDELRSELENELQTDGMIAAIAEGRQVPIKQLLAR